jgi:hypothetical protein
VNRRQALALPWALTLAACSKPSLKVDDFKLGILRPVGDGRYALETETQRLPRRLKSTGFRWGVQFANPAGTSIEWYEVIHLPSAAAQATGNLSQFEPAALRTAVQTSSDRVIVDNFWFDEGDPLGSHRLALFVDGTQCWTTTFEVVEG